MSEPAWPDADAAVIGAGIVGICAAAFLAEAGLRVNVFDRTGICEETSSGNAGAFGSMPFPAKEGGHDQLIDHASVVLLEKMLLEAGRNPSSIWLTPEKWDNFGEIAELWIHRTGKALALAIATVCSVIDFEAVIVDGGFSPGVPLEPFSSTMLPKPRENLSIWRDTAS